MTRRLLTAVSCSLAAALAAPALAVAADAGTWASAGQLGVHRGAPISARLADGSVLVGGGSAWSTAAASTQRYFPASNTWRPTADLLVPRSMAATVVLADGRVLVTGGRSDGYASLRSAELYDPATDTWTPAGQMSTARSLHSAVVLQDGRVLVVGGDGIYAPAAGAELYDPATGTWTPTGPVVKPRYAAAAARLDDGRVLVVGGWNGDTLQSAELFDPASGQWTATTDMAERRNGSGAARLPDGRVLVAGGSTNAGPTRTVSRTSEIYDPATATWSPSGLLNAPRGDAEMGTLANGQPFVSGGFYAEFKPNPELPVLPTWVRDVYDDTVERYDAATGTWTQSAPAPFGRSGHAAVPLADGSLLLAGGFSRWIQYGRGSAAETAADRYYPPGTATPTPTPTPVPPAAPAPPDGPKPFPQTLPRLSKLPSKLTVDRRGRIAFSVRCTGTTTCRDTLTLKTSKGRRLARKTFEVGANRKAIVRLTLSKTALQSVKRGSTKVMLALATRKQTTKATLTRR